MWVRIKPVDIEQAKERLAARHAEILARHANEIRSLDVDEAQIDELAGLVAAFMQKFKPPAPERPAPEPPVLAARPRGPWGDRQTNSLAVAGFDRAVLPTDRRVAPSGAVSIDFHRSRRKSGTG